MSRFTIGTGGFRRVDTPPVRLIVVVRADGTITWPKDLTDDERKQAIKSLVDAGIEPPSALVEGRQPS